MAHKSLGTLALTLRIATIEGQVINLFDVECTNHLFKDGFRIGMHMLNLLHLDLPSGAIADNGASVLANEL